MATIRNIVDDSLQRFRVVPGGGTATAIDANYAVRVLNRFMASGEMHGFPTNWGELALEDDFPLDQWHEQGVIALLAKALIEQFGKELTPVLEQEARMGLQALRNDYGIVEKVWVERPLRNMPSQYGRRRSARTVY